MEVELSMNVLTCTRNKRRLTEHQCSFGIRNSKNNRYKNSSLILCYCSLHHLLNITLLSSVYIQKIHYLLIFWVESNVELNMFVCWILVDIPIYLWTERWIAHFRSSYRDELFVLQTCHVSRKSAALFPYFKLRLNQVSVKAGTGYCWWLTGLRRPMPTTWSLVSESTRVSWIRLPTWVSETWVSDFRPPSPRSLVSDCRHLCLWF